MNQTNAETRLSEGRAAAPLRSRTEGTPRLYWPKKRIYKQYLMSKVDKRQEKKGTTAGSSYRGGLYSGRRQPAVRRTGSAWMQQPLSGRP